MAGNWLSNIIDPPNSVLRTPAPRPPSEPKWEPLSILIVTLATLACLYFVAQFAVLFFVFTAISFWPVAHY